MKLKGLIFLLFYYQLNKDDLNKYFQKKND